MGVRQIAGVSESVHCESFFFGAGRGARFCVLYEPANGSPRGSVLYVPPFAEEQNRTRRAAALCARAMASAGYAVLQLDLHGCGDSAGDFADATWPGWLDDLRHGMNILDRRAPGPTWLWGVRAGALLASDLIHNGYAHANLLLWQPVLSGAQHLKQFLRLRVARDARDSFALRETADTADTASLSNGRAQLASLLDLVSQEHATRRTRGQSNEMRADWICGKPVEVAGYTIAPALAFALDRAVFAVPRTYHAHITWLECVRGEQRAPSLPSQTLIGKLRAQEHPVTLEVVSDAPFWASTETVECPALVAATLRAMESP